jgi:pimeloyl-ACP methyl ester carboxylesterase
MTMPAAEPEVLEFRARDGLRLRADHWNPAAGAAPVVFAHGFGQTRHAWRGTASALAAAGQRCIAVDARGHGTSDRVADGRYDFDQFIDDARALTAQLGAAPVWVGASMGGLVGLIAEAESEDPLYSALVLVDITPRWERAGVERILAFMRAHPGGFESLAQAQQAVADYLPHRAARERAPERLEKLLVLGADGRWRWHWDPQLLDTVSADAGSIGGRLHEAARRVRIPLLLVSGGRSDVVSDHTIDEFLALAPHAEHQRIADATHMVAGDANDRFGAVIADFLARLPAGARATVPES